MKRYIILILFLSMSLAQASWFDTFIKKLHVGKETAQEKAMPLDSAIDKAQNKLLELKERCVKSKIKCTTTVLASTVAALVAVIWAAKKISEATDPRAHEPHVELVHKGTVHKIYHDNVNSPLDIDGNRAIHYAAQHDNLNNLITLFHFGAPIESKNQWGQTPLHKAVQAGQFDNVQYLLQQGAQLMQEDDPRTKYNPFHYAVLHAKKDNKETIENAMKLIALLAKQDRYNQYINEKSRNGTPLELALERKAPLIIVKVLVNQGAKITSQAKKQAQQIKDNQEVTRFILQSKQ